MPFIIIIIIMIQQVDNCNLSVWSLNTIEKSTNKSHMENFQIIFFFTQNDASFDWLKKKKLLSAFAFFQHKISTSELNHLNTTNDVL